MVTGDCIQDIHLSRPMVSCPPCPSLCSAVGSAHSRAPLAPLSPRGLLRLILEPFAPTYIHTMAQLWLVTGTGTLSKVKPGHPQQGEPNPRTEMGDGLGTPKRGLARGNAITRVSVFKQMLENHLPSSSSSAGLPPVDGKTSPCFGVRAALSLRERGLSQGGISMVSDTGFSPPHSISFLLLPAVSALRCLQAGHFCL